MKRLLLMTTGGTIASIQGEEGLSPGLDAEGLISYIPRYGQDYSIESKHLMNIDSTNMQPEWWVKIAEAVYEDYDHYDGFIITHGTDTMAYTAAALSYMLQNVSKPIIITGSQIPISQDKTDGKRRGIHLILINETVCRRIAYYRQKRKLTQAELASYVGINLKHLLNIEAGLKIPRINELVQLAAGLDLPIDELVNNK